jgi:carboxyl-terminal processing protease
MIINKIKRFWFLVFLLPASLVLYYAWNYGDKIDNHKLSLPNKTINSDSMEDIYQSINLLTEVIFSVKYYYYNDIPTSLLVKYAIKGITDNLDPYSKYLNATDSKALYDDTLGEFAGVGIQIGKNKNGEIEILNVLANEPAFNGGIKVGDLLYAIDSFNLQNISLNEISARLRGTKDTKVSLLLRRDDKYYNVVLKRKIIKPVVVSGKMYDNIMYIKISSFNYHTNNEVISILKGLQKNQNSNGLILDLRDNPGGLVEQAIAVADNFLDNAKIVSISSKGSQQVFVSNPGDILNNKPIVLLINSNSASSAEILAGALKDNDRATIVGNISYGKGLIQSLIPLSQIGEEIKLTTGEYIIPSGKSINNKGIEPDVYVFSNGEICESCNVIKLLELKKQEKIFLEKSVQSNSLDSYIDYQLRYALGIINNKIKLMK